MNNQEDLISRTAVLNECGKYIKNYENIGLSSIIAIIGDLGQKQNGFMKIELSRLRGNILF